jgi:hypothetical protein
MPGATRGEQPRITKPFDQVIAEINAEKGREQYQEQKKAREKLERLLKATGALH